MSKPEKNVKKTDGYENSDSKECFIITPIGSIGSETFTKAMGLIDAIIDPVLLEFGMTAMPANRIQELGSINKQLINRILDDELVIANLTGLNANVMYELAVRHAKRKPVIIMAEVGTLLPFDISDQRSIFYLDSLAGVEVAKEELRKKIPLALKDDSPDNPIYNAIESQSIIASFEKVDPNSPWVAVLEKLDKIQLSQSSIDDNRKISFKRLSAVYSLPRAQTEISFSSEREEVRNEINNKIFKLLRDYNTGIESTTIDETVIISCKLNNVELERFQADLRQIYPTMAFVFRNSI